jgi:predicted amidophosphoribosyltransferase
MPEMVRGRSTLLVDDVMTTGTTLDVCAQALLRAGARVVDGIVAARVIGPGRGG